MQRRALARLLVAALAVLALSAGAANLGTVGELTGPGVDEGTTPGKSTATPATDPADAAPVAPPPSGGACEGCPSTGWPTLIDVVGPVPGGGLLATLGVVALALGLSWHVLRSPAGAARSSEEDAPDRSAAVRQRADAATPTVDAPPATNEVYRAWLSLRGAVADRAGDEVASLTPGEVAAAARGRGLDPSAVGDLTRLFETVRYGGRPPSDERERRAAEARARLAGADALPAPPRDGRRERQEHGPDDHPGTGGGGP